MKDGRLAGMYKAGDAERSGVLQRARRAAELTDPTVLPPEGWNQSGELPRPFQSLLARGVMNLRGVMLLALFPADTPWFERRLASHIAFDPRVGKERVETINSSLQAQDMILTTKLESASDSKESRRSPIGFRSRQGQALDQLLVTGDVLQEVTDDFRIRNYRRDRYITKRDSCGDVVYHTIKRCVDVLSFDDKTLEKANLKRSEFEGKNEKDRVVDLYIHSSWQPASSVWKVEQELNGVTIAETQDEFSRFISTPYKLPLESDYGVGMIELLQGDGESLEELTRRILDFAALATRFLGVIDVDSEMSEDEM